VLEDAYVAAFAGPYQLTRYAHRTVERFPLLFATSTVVRVAPRGRLGIVFPGGTVEFEPLDSLRFREVGGDRLIAFRRDAAGRTTHLFASVPVFGAELPGALERRAWHDRARLMNEYVSWLVGAPLIAMLAAWPLSAGVAVWLRRRRGRPADPGGRGARILALASALLFSVLWTVFGFGFIAQSTRMLERANGIVFGVPSGMRWLAMIPYGLAILGAIVGVCAVLAWRRRYWDVVRRLEYTILALGAALTLAFLVRWNYLPPRFGP